MESNDLGRTLSLAKHAHKGQTRWGGEPYYENHILPVVQQVAAEGYGIVHQIVAALHDTVEDTYFTLDILREEGFTDRVIDAVEAMTHREDEPYYEYIKRLSYNPTAIVVKLEDLKHNLSTLTVEKHKGMINKYNLAKMFLELRLHQPVV